MNAEIKVDDLFIAEQNSVKPELKYNIAATDETLLTTAQLLQHTHVGCCGLSNTKIWQSKFDYNYLVVIK